jgi:hypothetical protein
MVCPFFFEQSLLWGHYSHGHLAASASISERKETNDHQRAGRTFVRARASRPSDWTSGIARERYRIHWSVAGSTCALPWQPPMKSTAKHR